MFQNSYYDTGSDQLSLKHKLGMVSIVWEHVMSDHVEATA